MKKKNHIRFRRKKNFRIPETRENGRERERQNGALLPSSQSTRNREIHQKSMPFQFSRLHKWKYISRLSGKESEAKRYDCYGNEGAPSFAYFGHSGRSVMAVVSIGVMARVRCSLGQVRSSIIFPPPPPPPPEQKSIALLFSLSFFLLFSFPQQHLLCSFI